MTVLCEMRWNLYQQGTQSEAYLVLRAQGKGSGHRGVLVLQEGREYCTEWLSRHIKTDSVLTLPEEWVQDGT